MENIFRPLERFLKQIERLENNRIGKKILEIDEFKPIMEIYQTIKQFTQSENYELIKYFSNSGEEVQLQLKKFLLESEKYRTGVLLWACQEYSSVFKFIQLISNIDQLPQIKLMKGGRAALFDFIRFLDKIKKAEPNYFAEEIAESKTLLFEKETPPIDFLSEKDPALSFFKKKISQAIQDISKPLNDYLTRYSEATKKHIASLEDDLNDFTQKIKDEAYDEIDTQVLMEKIQIGNNKIEKEFLNEKESVIDLIKINNDTINHDVKFLNEIYSNEYDKLIKEYIGVIKDIDSYNIDFAKFVKRLYHIYTKNNRDYVNNSNTYFLIDPRKYDPQTRNKLKLFFENELNTLTPYFSKFILKFFEYNYIRRLEAHEIPHKLKFSQDKKIVFVPRKGAKKDLKIHIQEIEKVKNTYGFFMDAILSILT